MSVWCLKRNATKDVKLSNFFVLKRRWKIGPLVVKKATVWKRSMFFFSWWFELRKQLLMLFKTLQNIVFVFFGVPWRTSNELIVFPSSKLFEAMNFSKSKWAFQRQLLQQKTAVLFFCCFSCDQIMRSKNVCLKKVQLVVLFSCCFSCDQIMRSKNVCLKKVDVSPTSCLPQSGFAVPNFFFLTL